jgi:hypothetical protein
MCRGMVFPMLSVIRPISSFCLQDRPYRLEIFIERTSLHFQSASIRTATELMRIKTSLGLTYFVNANGSLAAAPR